MMPYDDFKNMLLDFENSENDITDLIAAVCNLDQTTSFVSALTTMMQETSENDEDEGACNSYPCFYLTGR